jgi:PPOX class probable F420-dependent enzyme
MGPAQAYQLLRSVPVARLATVGPEGVPHIVPIVFALLDDDLVTAIDAKPKADRTPTRLVNIRHRPEVSVLADHYEDDWSRLWWVRLDGLGAIFTSGPELEAGLGALRARYRQYQEVALPGPLIRIEVQRVRGWRASPNQV